MKYIYLTRGTCSKQIELELDGDIIKDVRIIGGCDGNLKGIASIVKGMKAGDVISRFKGITCGSRSTSCPDQLARALREAIEKP